MGRGFRYEVARGLAAIASMALLLVGCGPPMRTEPSPRSGPTASEQALIASAKPAVEAANADWIPAMRRHDAQAIAAAYADDGLFVLPDGECIKGRAAVEAFYAGRMAQLGGSVDGSIASDGFAVAGGSVYEWGHAELVMERDGRRVTHGGAYLTVWRRDADGTWRILRNLAF